MQSVPQTTEDLADLVGVRTGSDLHQFPQRCQRRVRLVHIMLPTFVGSEGPLTIEDRKQLLRPFLAVPLGTTEDGMGSAEGVEHHGLTMLRDDSNSALFEHAQDLGQLGFDLGRVGTMLGLDDPFQILNGTCGVESTLLGGMGA